MSLTNPLPFSGGIYFCTKILLAERTVRAKRVREAQRDYLDLEPSEAGQGRIAFACSVMPFSRQWEKKNTGRMMSMPMSMLMPQAWNTPI